MGGVRIECSGAMRRRRRGANKGGRGGKGSVSLLLVVGLGIGLPGRKEYCIFVFVFWRTAFVNRAL